MDMGPGGYVDNSYAVLTASNDDGRASRVPANVGWVEVAAAANGADDWIILPTGVRPGHVVRGWSVPAHEIRTEPSSGIKINGVDSDGTAEAAIAATTLWRAEFVSATVGWILTATSEAGAAVATITPD